MSSRVTSLHPIRRNAARYSPPTSPGCSVATVTTTRLAFSPPARRTNSRNTLASPVRSSAPPIRTSGPGRRDGGLTGRPVRGLRAGRLFRVSPDSDMISAPAGCMWLANVVPAGRHNPTSPDDRLKTGSSRGCRPPGGRLPCPRGGNELPGGQSSRHVRRDPHTAFSPPDRPRLRPDRLSISPGARAAGGRVMAQPLPLIQLARHGETAWSLSGQHTGRTDIPLTARGEQAAVRLGERLRAGSYARVYTSPLERARRTCELAGFDGEVDPDLAEWDYGEYEGLTTPEIRARRPGWELFRDGCP